MAVGEPDYQVTRLDRVPNPLDQVGWWNWQDQVTCCPFLCLRSESTQTFTTWSLESRWSTMESLWYLLQFLTNQCLETFARFFKNVLTHPPGSLQNDEDFCRDHVCRRDSHSHECPDGTSQLLYYRPWGACHRWVRICLLWKQDKTQELWSALWLPWSLSSPRRYRHIAKSSTCHC